MNVADVLELYDYNRWATIQVFGVAATLTEEQLRKRTAASYETVFGTLAHVFWSEWVWLRRWTPNLSEVDPRSSQHVTQLKTFWAAFEPEQRRFLTGLVDADLTRVISYENPPGTTWSYSLQHMLQHVVNHSTYHRGQLTTLFRECGIAPRPLDFLVYFDVVTGAGA
jgi:uncharacterized damage-inducible protein DinB